MLRFIRVKVSDSSIGSSKTITKIEIVLPTKQNIYIIAISLLQAIILSSLDVISDTRSAILSIFSARRAEAASIIFPW